MAKWTAIVGLLALGTGLTRQAGVDHALLDSAFAVLLTSFIVLVALGLLHKDCDQHDELP